MKTAVVTGATRGIGKAISLKLLEEDYRVVGLYVSSDEAAKEIRKQNENIDFFKVDLADRDAIQKFIQSVDYDIDVLINNAGVYEVDDDADNFDISYWDKQRAVMVDAPLVLFQGLKDKIKSGGSVVNILSSDMDAAGFGNHSYSAAKAALGSFTKSWAGQVGFRNIRVNGLALGWVNSDMGADTDELKALIKEKTMLSRVAEPEEIANVVSFLVSDEASYVTSSTWLVDGGYQAVDYVVMKEG